MITSLGEIFTLYGSLYAAVPPKNACAYADAPELSVDVNMVGLLPVALVFADITLETFKLPVT